MNILKIEDLNFKYKNKKVLNDLNLTLQNGIIALLGPNGSGKSTLMKIIATLYETKNGNIHLNELDYSTDKNKIKGYIGYLPQGFDMYKNITGKEYLLFVARMKNVQNDKLDQHINTIVSALNLELFINKKISTYSGGVKRRLGIAQSIIGNPKLIILDEPTVGLDPEQRNEFRKLLPVISKDKIVIISTHIVEDIQFSCNKIVVLNDGNILYNGEIYDLTKNTTIYSTTLSDKEYNNLPSHIKVIDCNIINGKFNIKYVSRKELLNNSTRVDISLQDAYINLLSEESKE